MSIENTVLWKKKYKKYKGKYTKLQRSINMHGGVLGELREGWGKGPPLAIEPTEKEKKILIRKLPSRRDELPEKYIPPTSIDTQRTGPYNKACRSTVPILCGTNTNHPGYCRASTKDCQFQSWGKSSVQFTYLKNKDNMQTGEYIYKPYLDITEDLLNKLNREMNKLTKEFREEEEDRKKRLTEAEERRIKLLRREERLKRTADPSAQILRDYEEIPLPRERVPIPMVARLKEVKDLKNELENLKQDIIKKDKELKTLNQSNKEKQQNFISTMIMFVKLLQRYYQSTQYQQYYY
uniref:Uncharacterized protein n=1 Tax=Mimivirus LCMiAC02 TaxID=2506609 RepID=A0A481Z1U2_9VIRU|nr:MAG: hypothetical protein LCMiAC02_01180 [Mimivirus LCMiAC02]